MRLRSGCGSRAYAWGAVHCAAVIGMNGSPSGRPGNLGWDAFSRRDAEDAEIGDGRLRWSRYARLLMPRPFARWGSRLPGLLERSLQDRGRTLSRLGGARGIAFGDGVGG